jgi:hypothetical protein
MKNTAHQKRMSRNFREAIVKNLLVRCTARDTALQELEKFCEFASYNMCSICGCNVYRDNRYASEQIRRCDRCNDIFCGTCDKTKIFYDYESIKKHDGLIRIKDGYLVGTRYEGLRTCAKLECLEHNCADYACDMITCTFCLTMPCTKCGKTIKLPGRGLTNIASDTIICAGCSGK